MNALNDVLMASLRQLVLDHLPYDRQDADVVRELSVMSSSELLIRWFNWTRRMIPSKPRQVLKSKEFLANPALQQRNDDIEALLADIRQGSDLSKYLSRGVKHGYVNSSGVKPHLRQDIDLMLSAWGVHHLHFSQTIDPDGFVHRRNDKDIIFAIFRSKYVYLIDIMTHEDWVREHVVRVAVENWPNDELFYQFSSVEGLSDSISDAERQTLRNRFLNWMIEIDGKFYTQAGMTGSGVAVSSVIRADRVISDLEAFASMFEQDSSTVESLVTAAGGTWPENPEFAVTFRPEDYGVTEFKSRTFLRLGP